MVSDRMSWTVSNKLLGDSRLGCNPVDVSRVPGRWIGDSLSIVSGIEQVRPIDGVATGSV